MYLFKSPPKTKKPPKPLKRGTLKKSLGRKGKEKLKAMLSAKANFFEMGHFACQLCGGIFQMNDVVDAHHKIKRSLGGSDDMTNLVVLHRNCHFGIHSNAEAFLKTKTTTENAINGRMI